MMDSDYLLKFLSGRNGFIGCEFWVFGSFSYVFSVLGLFLLFCLGFKYLQFGWVMNGRMQFSCDVRGKSNDLRSGFCSKHDFDEVFYSNTKTIRSSSVKLLDDCKEPVVLGEDTDEKDKEICPEDEEFEVMTLRKLLKIERNRSKAIRKELKKERIAAASAVNEAMAMILRLQSEKSAMEIDANQYKRMAQQKQEFDHRVNESLQWIVLKHESERCLLENQLQLYKQKLKHYMREDELNQFEADSGFSFSHASLGYGMENESFCSRETETLSISSC